MTPSLHAFALFRSIVTKFLAEGQAHLLSTAEGCYLLRYREPHSWQGPPSFKFELELLTLGAPSPEIKSLLDEQPEKALVIRSFETEAPKNRQIPFMPLLAKSIVAPRKHAPRPVRGILSADDIDSVNRTHRGSNAVRAGILSDPRIKAFCLEIEGKAVASGAFVIDCETGIAYLADMYTVREFRRQGLGSAILEALLEQASALGMREAILLPSLLARKFKFYERFGFQPAGGLRVGYFLPRAFSII